ncbi:MAG: hypothetical protein Q9181_003735 [Wetmoreana brouardii]
MSRRAGMLPKQNFGTDEKVLCFHGEMLYEAKILDVRQEPTTTSPYSYRIHYKGWKNTWDDWVEEDRLRKLNDENRELAQTLNRQVKESNQKPTRPTASKKKGLPSDFGSARGSEERSATAQATGRGQKRGRNMEIDEVGNDPLFDPTTRPKRKRPRPLAAQTAKAEDVFGPVTPLEDIDQHHYVSKGIYTYLGSGLYSPTESLLPFLDPEIYVAIDDDSGRRIINNLVSLPACGQKAGRGSSSGAAVQPASQKSEMTQETTAKGSSTPRTPPKEQQSSQQSSSKKRRRSADEEEEDNDESPLAKLKRKEELERQLQKEAIELMTSCIGDVKEHPDFPRPPDRQTYPIEETLPNPRVSPKRVRKKTNKTKVKEASVNDVSDKQEETFHNRPMIKIPVPDYIKSLLVDDWEEVTKNLSLVPLPAAKPVNTIIDDYFEEEKEKRFPGSADMDFLEEVRAGLKEYFDVALGRMLLYRFERQQYLEARNAWTEGKGEWKGKTCVGDVYGAEHLCRMIVAMPEMIAQTNMDGQSVNRLREELTKFLQWLGRNTRTYFTADYEPAGQDTTASPIPYPLAHLFAQSRSSTRNLPTSLHNTLSPLSTPPLSPKPIHIHLFPSNSPFPLTSKVLLFPLPILNHNVLPLRFWTLLIHARAEGLFEGGASGGGVAGGSPAACSREDDLAILMDDVERQSFLDVERESGRERV